ISGDQEAKRLAKLQAEATAIMGLDLRPFLPAARGAVSPTVAPADAASASTAA
ncbi:MAG: hypothetical protein JOZ46_03150, partial [Candidatus Dormibacteraeota bacterium]|nr:hypothetical protein [Candidatus Dormibacteraeota bacterium]